MDCEKFDTVMLDELYGELDEVTSAAAKRHLSGCARCSSAFAGLKATRRVAVLPLAEPPDDLHERILAKAWEAQKVVPIRSKFGRFVSAAGSWAMRPQTAMAAMFLLMIGVSVIYMSGRAVHQSSQSASQSFAGSPSPISGEKEEAQRLDYAAAASAHGTEQRKQAPLAAATASASPEEIANLDPNQQQGQGLDGVRNGALGGAPGGGGSGGSGLAFGDDYNMSNSGPAAGAIQQQAAPTSTALAKGAYPPPTGYGQEAKDKAASDLERGKNEYRDKKFDEATKTLDAIQGSPDAALWAARSVRDSKGCAAAVVRFDEISSKNPGTLAGAEATFDAGACYEKMGRTDLAKARYTKMLTVPQYAARAQNELDRLRPVSVKPSMAPRSVESDTKSTF